MAPRTLDAGRTVTSKVLAILDCFSSSSPTLSLSQIAEGARLPMPTAHRLVHELVEWGALTRQSNGSYMVGMRLWEIAQNGARQLRDQARPILQDVFQLTGETTHLALRDGRQALFIDRVYSAKGVPRASRVGGRLPLHVTAVGKVLLANEEEWFQHAYVEQPLEAPTRRTTVAPRKVLAELAEIRKNGFASTVEELRVGACSVAVPVPSEDGRVRLSLGIVLPTSQVDHLARHVPTLRGAARRLLPVTRQIPTL